MKIEPERLAMKLKTNNLKVSFIQSEKKGKL
jgi:hypothetical protein